MPAYYDKLTGVEVKVYRGNDPKGNELAVLHNAYDIKGLDEIGGPGGGSFSIHRDDPVLARLPACLDYYNIVRIFNDNVAVAGFVIEEKENVIVSKTETAGLVQTASGAGLLALTKAAVVEPYKGLKTFSSQSRNFNFASELGTWFDASAWLPAVSGNRQGDPPESNKWAYGPVDWPDAPDARWIWDRPYSDSQPKGDVYFRYTLNVPSEADYSVFITADDTFDLYVDGQLVADHHDNKISWSETNQIDFRLTAGDHIVGVKVTNDARAGKAGLLAAIFRYGDPNAPTAAQLVAKTGDVGWLALGYPARLPYWTPGEVVNALLAEARDRGVDFPSFLQPTFTNEKDSNGQPWVREIDWSFKVGTDYFDVFRKIADLSCDMWIDPATLDFHMYKERSRDLSESVELAPGKNIAKAEDQGKADVKTRFNILTDDGWTVKVDPAAEAKYGRREGSLETSNNMDFANSLARVAFAKQSTPETSTTISILPTEKMVPFTNYKVGDWVLAPRDGFGRERRRIMSLAISTDAAGNALFDAEFDTIFQDRVSKLERWLENAEGAASATGGGAYGGAGGGSSAGTPGTSPVTSNLPRRPVAPTGLTVIGQATWLGGQASGFVNANWTAVTRGVDGLTMVVTSYEIWGQSDSVNQSWALLGTTNTPYTTLNNFAPLSTWSFKVRAKGNRPDIYSDFSAVQQVTVPNPSEFLQRPTFPQLKSKLGVVSATWNGALLLSEAEAIWPPERFDYTYAAISDDPQGSFTRAGTSLRGAGTLTIPDLTVGTRYYVKFYAVDKANGVSAPSDVRSIVVTGIDLGTLEKDVSDAIKAAQDAADAAALTASGAQTTADGKGKIWYEDKQPIAPRPGYDFSSDVWFDMSNGYKPMRWNSFTGVWESAQDRAITSAAEAATAAQLAAEAAQLAAQTSANGKNKNYYQAARPTPPSTGFNLGDLWFDTDNGNAAYVWDGSDWIPTSDGELTEKLAQAAKDAADAINAAKAAELAAAQAVLSVSEKGRTIFSNDPPPGSFSDLWIDTSLGNNTPNRWNGFDWVPSSDKLAVDANTLAKQAKSAAEQAARDAEGARISADGKNTNYYLPVEPTPPPTGFVLNDTWFNTAADNAINIWAGAEGWVPAPLGTTAIADAAITNAKISSLDAGKITTGTLDADRISANSITVEKLTIGSFDNLMYDPSFAQGGKSWSLPTSSLIVPGAGRGAQDPALVLSHTNFTQTVQQAPGFKTISSGASYLFTVWMKASVKAQVTLGVTWRRESGVNAYATITPDSLVPGVWTKVSRIVQAPQDAVDANFYVEVGANRPAGLYTLDFISVTRASNGELIVDGSITTGKLTSNSVTANEIAAGSITADKIQAGSITAGKIAADAITANTIQAGAITAAKIAADAVTANTIAANAITTQKLAAGAITAEKIATGTITAESGVIASLDASKITTGTLNASRIAAGSISANQLTLGDFTNLVDDPELQKTQQTWFKDSGTVNAAVTNTVEGYGWAWELQGNTVRQVVRNGLRVPVQPNDRFLLQGTVRNTTRTKARGLLVFANQSGVELSSAGFEVLPNVGWVTASAELTVPAGAFSARFYYMLDEQSISGTATFARPVFRRMATGSLIVDGSITASKIAANVITADKIQAGTITANEISANAITAGKIQAGAITADKIGAKEVTAGKLAAGSVATENLQAESITAEKLQAGSITALKIAAGSITADKLAVGAIEAQHLAITVGGQGTPTNRLPAPINDRDYWTKVKNGDIKFKNEFNRAFWAEASVTAQGIAPGYNLNSTVANRPRPVTVTDSHRVPISRQLRISITGGSETATRLIIRQFLDDDMTVESTQGYSIWSDQTITFGASVRGWYGQLYPVSASSRITALEIYEVAGAAPGTSRVTIDPSGVNVLRADDTRAVTLDSEGLRGVTTGGKTSFDINASGITVYNALDRPAVQLGYGVSTGMSILNPNNNLLQPIAPHVFGSTVSGGSGIGQFSNRQGHSKRFIPLSPSFATVTSVSGRFYVSCTMRYSLQSGVVIDAYLRAFSASDPQNSTSDTISITETRESAQFSQDESKSMNITYGSATIQGILYLPIGQTRVLGVDMAMFPGQYQSLGDYNSQFWIQTIFAMPI
jgi:hypothetical protein